VSALAAKVVAAVLLDYKSTLHGWLKPVGTRNARRPADAGAVGHGAAAAAGHRLRPQPGAQPLSAVVGGGLAGRLSLAGHAAMRFRPQRGAADGRFRGVATSTSATLALARQARREPACSRRRWPGRCQWRDVVRMRSSPCCSRRWGGGRLPLLGAGGVLFTLAAALAPW
jgi:hypothetical protein